MDGKKQKKAWRDFNFYISSCRWAWKMANDLSHSSPSMYTLKMQVKKVHWCPPPDGVSEF
jgi:hypothetical protein